MIQVKRKKRNVTHIKPERLIRDVLVWQGWSGLVAEANAEVPQAWRPSVWCRGTHMQDVLKSNNVCQAACHLRNRSAEGAGGGGGGGGKGAALSAYCVLEPEKMTLTIRPPCSSRLGETKPALRHRHMKKSPGIESDNKWQHYHATETSADK